MSKWFLVTTVFLQHLQGFMMLCNSCAQVYASAVHTRPFPRLTVRQHPSCTIAKQDNHLTGSTSAELLTTSCSKSTQNEWADILTVLLF